MRLPLIGGPKHGATLDINPEIEVFEVPVLVDDSCQVFFKVPYRIVKIHGRIHAEPLFKDWLQTLLKDTYRQGLSDGARP